MTRSRIKKFKLTHAANSKHAAVENALYATTAQYHPSTFYGFYRPIKKTKDCKNIDITKQLVAEPKILKEIKKARAGQILKSRTETTIPPMLL